MTLNGILVGMSLTLFSLQYTVGQFLPSFSLPLSLLNSPLQTQSFNSGSNHLQSFLPQQQSTSNTFRVPTIQSSNSHHPALPLHSGQSQPNQQQLASQASSSPLSQTQTSASASAPQGNCRDVGFLYRCLQGSNFGLQGCINECMTHVTYTTEQKLKCEVNCYDLYYRRLSSCITLESKKK